MTEEVTQVIIKCYQAVWKDKPALEKLNEIADTCLEALIYPLDGSERWGKLSDREVVIADEIADRIESAIHELRNPPYQGDEFEPVNDTIVEMS